MRRLGPEDMLELGVLENIDSLTTIVQTEHVGPAMGGPAERAKLVAAAVASFDTSTPEGQKAVLELMKDKKKWTTMLSFINTITAAAVVEPNVFPVPDKSKGHAPRVDGMLYIDEVDLADRLSIMQEALAGMVGQVQAMEPFRSGSTEGVEHVSDGKDVQQPTIGSGGVAEVASR